MAEKIKQLHPVYNFDNLEQRGKVMAEYIWIGGGSAVDIRSKITTVAKDRIDSVDELKIWNYDGSSTNQAEGHDSEVLLKPVRYYPDPFRGGNNVLVLCETYKPDGSPARGNFRGKANELMEAAKDEQPWFGIEQEYTLLDPNTFPRWPLGWPQNGYPGPQGPYYCGVGASYCIGRKIMEDHYKACLHCGLNISGTNGEVMPGQWEFQIGPCEGIDEGDHMTLARYLLMRVAESYNVDVSFEPKPVRGDWNGAGCHTNYSTKSMREEGGYDKIIEAIKKLEKVHQEHIAVYGPDNSKRLTGRHETADIGQFSYGVANRGASVRIPRDTEKDGKGYMEDRRPAANIDPYVVTSAIVDTTCLQGEELPGICERYQEFISECS